jgi:hypothetical protein
MATPIADVDQAELPRFIAVEGPIGVGKTTLARRLSETFRYPTLLEPAAENPSSIAFTARAANTRYRRSCSSCCIARDNSPSSAKAVCSIRCWSPTS